MVTRLMMGTVVMMVIATAVHVHAQYPYCVSDLDCMLTPSSYCAKQPGNCGGIGFCKARPDVCSWIHIPVCGCDGRTYINAGCAAVYGMNVAYDGVCLPNVAILDAVSRKTHGQAGVRDIDLRRPTGNNSLAVESRIGGPTEIQVTFDRTVTANSGTASVQLISTGPANGTITGVSVNGNEVTITMYGTSDAAKLTLAFPGICDIQGMMVTDELTFGFLAGDATGDGVVNIFDLLTTRDKLNAAVSDTNARLDIQPDGKIDVLDLLKIRLMLNRRIS